MHEHEFLLTLLFTFIIGEINASDSRVYLVIWSKEGQNVAYKFTEKPIIRFEKDMLVLETKEVKDFYDINQYSRMTFENELTTGLQLEGEASTVFQYDDNNLVFPNLKRVHG